MSQRKTPMMAELSTARQPLLAQPWQAGIIGWIVVFGAVISELAGGIITNSMSMTVAASVLLIPVLIVDGFAFVQWYQVRSSDADPASWWHLTGIALALFSWISWPITPGILSTVSSASDACSVLYTATPSCVARVTAATHNSHLAWWLTGALIMAAALLARQSRIAPWAAIPAAFAGCMLAAHFQELLLIYYHYSGA